MQFKIGDKVMITRERDANWPTRKPKDAGKIGFVIETDSSCWGPFAVEIGRSWYYCRENEIEHTDGPAPIYDKRPNRPWDKWEPVRQWKREAR